MGLAAAHCSCFFRKVSTSWGSQAVKSLIYERKRPRRLSTDTKKGIELVLACLPSVWWTFLANWFGFDGSSIVSGRSDVWIKKLIDFVDCLSEVWERLARTEICMFSQVIESLARWKSWRAIAGLAETTVNIDSSWWRFEFAFALNY